MLTRRNVYRGIILRNRRVPISRRPRSFRRRRVTARVVNRAPAQPVVDPGSRNEEAENHNNVTTTSTARNIIYVPPERQTRKHLNVREKLQVIDMRNEGNSVREITNRFGCRRTQVYQILRLNRADLAKKIDLGHGSRKKLNSRLKYPDIEQKMITLLTRYIGRKPYNGPGLQWKALQFARELGHKDFTASNGWLEAFLKRHKQLLKPWTPPPDDLDLGSDLDKDSDED